MAFGTQHVIEKAGREGAKSGALSAEYFRAVWSLRVSFGRRAISPLGLRRNSPCDSKLRSWLWAEVINIREEKP